MNLILSTVKSSQRIAGNSTNVPLGYKPANITLVYKNTGAGSRLRLFLLDGVLRISEGYVKKSMPDLATAEGSEYTMELLGYLYSLAKHLVPVLSRRWAGNMDLCRYHYHPGAPAGFSCISEIAHVVSQECHHRNLWCLTLSRFPNRATPKVFTSQPPSKPLSISHQSTNSSICSRFLC
jgi:hypothetical protein